MAKSHEKLVDKVLGRMTLDEKVGACIVQSWRGSMITPCVVETIEKLHCTGLRIEPYTTEAYTAVSYGRAIKTTGWRKPKGYFEVPKTYFKVKHPGFNIPATEYARRLNKLKEIAMNRRSGVPLHIVTDYEGDFSHDFPFDGINMFPSNMGVRAAGGPKLAYKVAYAVARQISAIGVNMLHSPVLDVNIHPSNPEINIRAFSDDPEIFCKYAVPFMKGLEDGGIIAAGKHYPGRGDSAIDAHNALPVIAANRRRINRVELAPYRALIKAGLRSVMVAHNAYPALDAADIPATVSRKIVTGVLREQLGFNGVITTDAMGMGAIARRWGIPQASAMALKAGCDIVLLKFDNEQRSQVFFEIKRWLQRGDLTEDELDERVRRVLLMKAEQGLFKNGGVVNADKATPTLRKPEFVKLCRDVARRATMVMRDRQGLLPLKKDQKALIIEQMIIPEFVPNNMHYHAHSFNEAMLNHSLNVVNMDCEFAATAEEKRLALKLLKEVDVVVMTNYYWRVLGTSNEALVKAIARRNKPLIIVTNNPYEMGATPEAGTVVCTFGVGPQSLKAAADVIFGKIKPRGNWPLKKYRLPR